jgi:UDP-N-acetylglucosamine--N-acetylmuramyl-(pentapeptide) pyrophosphoryl-undecaprenol N-acetylglucosamine transferase
MRIVLTGGGSGGHIFPLIAVAQELRREYGNIDLQYIGSNAQMGAMAKKAMTQEGIKTTNILAGKMRRYFSFRNIVDAFLIPIGFFQALIILLILMPDAVFSKGGYVSVPVVLAAWLYRIPVLTHDSDAVPGWANRICGKYSKYVAVSYRKSEEYFLQEKTLITGNPIRQELLQGNPERARQRWGLNSSKPVIFITGGSQGAQLINKAIIKILPELTHLAQIVHITGPNNFEGMKHLAAEYGFRTDRHRYVAVPFLERDEMADAYAIADLIIARSGANSITEIAANQKPAILIPLASAANNHQYMNAFEIAKLGGAVVMEEGNLGDHIFLDKIKQILSNEALRNQMKEKIAQFYHPDAAQKIVAGIQMMLR